MREVSTPKLIGIFAITTLIFLSGFMFARFLTDTKLSDLDNSINDIALQTASVETEYNLLLENPCIYGGFAKLTSSLGEFTDKLVFNDAQRQQNQDKIESIKDNYFLLETRHWIFVQKLNSECKTNFTPILYFYSDAGDCEVCKAQGIVLSTIKQDHPDTMIYSFDVNTDYSLVGTIKQIYGVKAVPSIVINDKLYGQFMNQDDIEKILKRQKVNSTSEQDNSEGQQLNDSSVVLNP